MHERVANLCRHRVADAFFSSALHNVCAVGIAEREPHPNAVLTFIRLVRICFRLLDAGGRLQGWLPCPARGARALAIRWHRAGSTVNPFSSPQSQ